MDSVTLDPSNSGMALSDSLIGNGNSGPTGDSRRLGFAKVGLSHFLTFVLGLACGLTIINSYIIQAVPAALSTHR